MSKKKHPNDRAERLRLKELHEQKKATEAANYRRRLKEQIKDQETRDALQSVYRDVDLGR